MGTAFKAYAASAAGQPLRLIEFDPGPLRDEQVEIRITHCGICHSDLSMMNNEWGITAYPFVPGHEAVGVVAAVGSHARGLRIGQRVGLGWFTESCMTCPECLSGNQNLCPTPEQTIVNHHGAFADRIRCHWLWATPIPEKVDPAKAGPLFCAGITVFNPMIQFNVRPTDRVGVIGIGGLGHLALQFLNKWGCEVYAFTTNDSKRDEAKRLGAHHVINTGDPTQIQKIARSLDFIISTVNVSLDWPTILDALAPKGRLHVVGVATEPIPVPVFPMILGQKSVSGSPVGSPNTVAKMLDFCARHGIAPATETFPLSSVNEAMEHLHSGKARYRIVLESDLP